MWCSQKHHYGLRDSYKGMVQCYCSCVTSLQSVSLQRKCKKRYSIEDRTSLDIYGASVLELKKWVKQKMK